MKNKNDMNLNDFESGTYITTRRDNNFPLISPHI